MVLRDTVQAWPRREHPWRKHVPLLCLFAAGALLRLYGLGVESVDLEEWACLANLDAPDLKTFLERQRVSYPYGAPLTPILYYFWARLSGPEIAALRLLPALAGILAMPLIYGLACTLFPKSGHGKRVGVIAVACVAFSPVHVFHAQEARMYAFVSLFALTSILTLVRAARLKGAVWLWAAHLAANTAMVWSHYLLVFLLPVQGMVLLVWEGRITRRVMLWGAAHLLLCLLVLAWVSRIPRQADELYEFYRMPEASAVVINAFAGDSTHWSGSSFFPSQRAWSFLPEPQAQLVRAMHPVADVLLLLIFFTAWCYVLFRAVAPIFRRRGEENGEAAIWALLGAWAVLPALLLVAVSIVWQPVYASRFVVTGLFALYLAWGRLVSGARRPWRYRMAALLVGTLFAYQLSLALPPQTRTAWRQVMHHVAMESTGKPLLLLENPFWLPVLEWNRKEVQRSMVAAAFERDTLCKAASAIMRAAGPGVDVWVLLVRERIFDEAEFVQCLHDDGADFERTDYPGGRPLVLFQIAPYDGAPARAGASVTDVLGRAFADKGEPPDWEAGIRFLPDREGGFWMRLALTAARHGRPALASFALYRALETDAGCLAYLIDAESHLGITTDYRAWTKTLAQMGQDPCARLGRLLRTIADRRSFPTLLSLARAVIETLPDCPSGRAFAGLALHQLGRNEDAAYELQQAHKMDFHTEPDILEAWAQSLLDMDRPGDAAAILETAMGRFPDHPWLHMRLGMALETIGRHEEAVRALEVTLRHYPNDALALYLMLNPLMALGDYARAAETAMHPSLADAHDTWVLLARWRALAGEGVHEGEAHSLFRRLADLEPSLRPVGEALYERRDAAALRRALESLADPNLGDIPELRRSLERLEREQAQ